MTSALQLGQSGSAKGLPPTEARAGPRTRDREHPYTRTARGVAAVLRPLMSPDYPQKADAKLKPQARKALEFSRLSVRQHEVELLALAGMLLMLVGGLVAAALANFVVGLDIVDFLIYMGLPVFGLSVATLLFLGNFPDNRAVRLRAKSLGQLPEVIHYLAMSMRLTGSLSASVQFAADNVEEPMASSLRRVLWRVTTREVGTVEESLVTFAYEWGEQDEDFKRAIYIIIGAGLEATDAARGVALDKATDVAVQGTRRKAEAFAASLSGPATTFFALCVILPVIVGTMLPTMAMFGASMSKWGVVALLDVAFPAAAGAYAYTVLGKRPGTRAPPELPRTVTRERHVQIALLASVVGIALSSLAFVPIPFVNATFGKLPIIWGLAAGFAIYFQMTTREAWKLREATRKFEDEFPDALHQLGSRIGEGQPVETAAIATMETMRGTETSSFLRRLVYLMQVMRASLSEALFGENGATRFVYSPTIRSNLRAVVSAAAKDARIAGKTIVSIAGGLKDLLDLDRDTRTQLAGVSNSLVMTGLLFAPVVMGVTGSIFVLLQDTMGDIEITNDAVASQLPVDVTGSKGLSLTALEFQLILGVFLLFSLVVITYFTSELNEGADRLAFRHQLGLSLVPSAALYSLAVLLGNLYLG